MTEAKEECRYAALVAKLLEGGAEFPFLTIKPYNTSFDGNSGNISSCSSKKGMSHHYMVVSRSGRNRTTTVNDMCNRNEDSVHFPM